MDSLVQQLSPSEPGAKTYGLTDVLAKSSILHAVQVSS